MFLFVLWRNERSLLDHSHPDWVYYFPVRWWLIPHGLGGPIALVAGPFQFSSTPSTASAGPSHDGTRLSHRGRDCRSILGVPVSDALHPGFSIFLTFATAWYLTTTVAFAAVRNRNVQIHREWMVRSYAITTTFVTTRVLTAIPAIGAGGEGVS